MRDALHTACSCPCVNTRGGKRNSVCAFSLHADLQVVSQVVAGGVGVEVDHVLGEGSACQDGIGYDGMQGRERQKKRGRTQATAQCGREAQKS